MDTKPLEQFATRARRELLAAVEAQASTVLAVGSVARSERGDTVKRLEDEITSHGHKHVIDKVAYTWFNRLIALRYMDARGYTSAGVVSPAQGHAHGQPEILADAKRGHLDTDVVTNTRTREAIVGLLDGTRRSADAEGEAYSLLLTEYCRHWNKAMSFMFEREGDYTELLVPSGLLADGAILVGAREVLTEEVCADVEVLGWLYQFYISERKDEVFAGFKKNKKAGADEIPAATQLFTPHWIVRYLVENSIGRLWMLNHPDSRLIDQMDYYIVPVDEETDFLKIAGPEELTVIDPACGSGHMLTYAFDLLYAIYEEQGYAPSEIPALILAHNLYGTEIDPRAGALAAFALTMKARARQRTFFNKLIEPNICVLEPLSFTPDELELLSPPRTGRAERSQGQETFGRFDPTREEIDAFWNQFQHADIFGSLIRPDADFIETLRARGENLEEGTLGAAELREAAEKVLDQAEYLSRRYHVAIANPPYMGRKQMNALFSEFMKESYPNSKSDLFAAFIERCAGLALPRGAAAMITMQSWMFLSSYEKLRASLLANQRITSMLHLGTRGFDSIGGEVVSSTAFVLNNRPAGSRDTAVAENGIYVRLVDGRSQAEKVTALHAALASRVKETGYHLASGDDFAAIPGSPIVYWLSEKMRAVFTDFDRLIDFAEPRQGLATADDGRFLRRWWEVAQERFNRSAESVADAKLSACRWFPFTKGGEYRRWYGNNEYVVNWEAGGRDLYAFRPRSVIRNPDVYFKPAATYGLITSGDPSFRFSPAGSVVGHKGPIILAKDPNYLIAITAYINSASATRFLQVLSPNMGLEVGQISNLPIPPQKAIESNIVEELVRVSRADWDSSELSWHFEQDPLVNLALSAR